MTIYRAEPPETETIDIELNKKGGKNLGIGFFTTNPHGLFITDIVRLVPKKNCQERRTFNRMIFHSRDCFFSHPSILFFVVVYFRFSEALLILMGNFKKVIS